jgi:hypothetical protein
MKLGGEVRPGEMRRMIVGGDIAVVSNHEVGDNAGSDGRPDVVQKRGRGMEGDQPSLRHPAVPAKMRSSISTRLVASG